MHRRSLTIIGLLVILALPLSASQFIQMPFDQIASESTRWASRATARWVTW